MRRRRLCIPKRRLLPERVPSRFPAAVPTLISALVVIIGTNALMDTRPVIGQIAREGARLGPAMGGWISMDPERGKAILRQLLPVPGETGPDPWPHFGLQHSVRSWVYMALSYDLSQPRSMLLAALPRGAGTQITVVRRPVVGELAGASTMQWEGVSDGSGSPAASEPEPQTDSRPTVTHASTPSLAALQRVQWGSDPLVLIFHTHTSEMYAEEGLALASAHDYHRFNSTDTGITRVGEIMARTLNERYGIPVVHSKSIHDFPTYTQSYQRSAKTVQDLLRKYPSIRVVLDVHRDGVRDASFVRDVSGQKVAQVMLIVTRPGSYPESLHPRWQENTGFARKMEETMEELYPGLLKRYPVVGNTRYNQHLHPNMVLLEIGTYADDERYAQRSAALLADVIAVMVDQAKRAAVASRTPAAPAQPPAASARPEAPALQKAGRVPVGPGVGGAPQPRSQRP